MPTFLPGPAFQCLSGDQVVMPAQRSGEAAAGSRFAGTFSVYDSSTTTFSE